MKKYIFILLIIPFVFTAFDTYVNQHSSYDQLLKKHVSVEGKVDYQSFKKDHTKLKAYINELKSSPIARSVTQQKQLAYWINLYNALTINLILDHYPVKSIMDIDKAWDLPLVSINGSELTLNDIEHKIIRPKFNDPRVHFAVNCAARSCPKLLNEAYLGTKLEQQLDSQTRWFVNNKSFNQLTSSSVKVSKIFEWYRDDFGNLVSFLNRYSDLQIAGKSSVSYLEYDWSLNDK